MDVWLDQQDFLQLSQQDVDFNVEYLKNVRRKRYALQFENGDINAVHSTAKFPTNDAQMPVL